MRYSARGASPATRAAAAAGTRPGADQDHGGDEDSRIAKIVELLTASLSSAQQRRAPRPPRGAGADRAPPPRSSSSRVAAPPSTSTPPKTTALALSETKELTDTTSARCWHERACAPPSPPPSGDMDALDDVGDPAGARVERGRGSIHNGVADQALANPDMSIAEILFASPRLLLWRLTMWCAALPWRAAYVAACVARAPYRAPRAGSTTVAVLRLLSSWTATMSSLTASPSRSRPSASPSCETRS